MRVLASTAAFALIVGAATAARAQDAAAPAPALETPPTVAPGVVAGDPPDAAAALVAAAATGDETPPQRDPLEGFNRAMWGLNMGLDKIIVKPVSTVYRTITPRPARRGLSRVLSNLTEPFSFINGLLQGKPDRAFNSLGRFVVNTTVGVAGLGDPASKMGMKPTPEDFGQTLAHWGVKSSAYLVLPLLGPSTIRDGVGTGVAFFADPYRIGLRESGLSTWEQRGVNAFEVVSARSDLTDAGGDTFLETSLDSYAVARSAYLQRRQAAIQDEDGSGVSAAGGAAGNAADDAALNAAVADIREQQGASGETPSTDAPATDPTAPAPDPLVPAEPDAAAPEPSVTAPQSF
jgi:phospholipid-binding lipoprotein MlaA